MLQTKSRQVNAGRITTIFVVVVLLGIIAVILNGVPSVRLGPYLRIGFGWIPNRLMDFLFGPAAGAAFGAVMNGVTYAVRPEGPFFPGFILSAVTASLICGMNTLRAFAPLRKKYFR
ncbi:MAG: hypothetical protein LKF96_07195 [Treponema sp.]|jgi:ECF transporter S component (folate family)|nr:hypothetical protein [Treponema sp.]